ncbi:MAG: T9SS type A sorting domain-containing protein [Flavobacteriaceae bacterium]|nr:T9SS type A sorting domain-containing protein [Flavobacteriaceae bacterium]
MKKITQPFWINLILLCLIIAPFTGYSQTCGTTVTAYPYTEGFEAGFLPFTQDAGDNFNWSRRTTPTPSSNTGPNASFEGSYYAYTESSNPNYPSRTANLESPCFDLTTLTSPVFSFYYHMYGSSMGTLSVDISTDNGTTYPTNLWSVSGQQHNSGNAAWTQVTLDLTPYIGQIVKLRFNGVTGTSYRSDMAIDDIRLENGTITVPPSYSAYYETFDATNGGWNVVTATNGNWTWTNSFTTTDEMGEGNFWRNTNYNSYNSNTNIIIESPVYDFTGLQDLKFSIDIKYNTENNTDGMRILYSVNGGAFTILGASGQGTNWYQDNVSALGSDGWNNDGHSATPSFTPHSQFGRSSIDLDNATFSGQSNVRFQVQFRSNGSTNYEGVAFDNVLIEANPITALNDASVAPASLYTDLRLWLKANDGISVSDGAPLTLWEDQAFDTSLDKEDASSATSLAPIYRDNINRNMNYNPVADFNNTVTEYMNGKGGFYAKDYFVVMRSDDVVDTQTGAFTPGRQFGIGGRYADESFHEDPSGLGLGSTSARFSNEILSHNVSSFPNGSQPPNSTSWGRSYSTTTESYQNHPIIINVKSNAAATSTEIYKNGKRVDNTTGQAGNGDDLNFNEFENLQYLVGMGRSGITGRTTSQMNGMITEIISYTSPNSAINQQKIQSYLAVKYGVTMQSTSSTATSYRLNDVDYIDSNGTVIWDTSTHAGHNFDIAGIGRDDASLLLQKQSRSQNDEADGLGPISGFLTMALTQTYNTNNENISNNTTTFNDREFLMWGNNNADLNGAPINIMVDMSSAMGNPSLITQVSFTGIPRIWKVVETGGDVPKVEVSIPKSIVRTAAPPDGRYLMFISQNGIFDPTAGYRVMTEVGDTLYAEYDFDGTEYITFGWAPEQTYVRSIHFLPSNGDYLDVGDHLEANPAGFTMSAWANRFNLSTNTSILSKRNDLYTEGYDFKINALNRFEVSWYDSSNNLQLITSSVAIPRDEWHQLAVIYDGSRATLYIDGVADTSAVLSPPVDTSESFYIGAAGTDTPTNFFHGNVDEVRVWDTALTEGQLRYIMNQEIIDNSNFVAGSYFYNRGITPTKDEIASIPWSKLLGYYPMSTYTYTNAKDESGNGHQGALRNLVTVDWQSAPLPYYSDQNGNWDTNSTWLNGTVQTIPGTTSIVDNTKSIDWNIVETNHDLTIDDDSDLPIENSGNRSVLALMVDSNEITVNGSNIAKTGYGLTVTHYLNLDGDIDLEGESQLIQTLDSDLAVTSAGKIERDQQGTSDVYTYNYWSSPVGVSNITSNNNNYTVPDVVRDGNQNIDWITTGYDGTNTSPIGIADYWIWKFNNLPDDDYDSWAHVRSTGNLLAGEGYTMKGPGTGSILTDQNYVYTGKPNNGVINLPLNAGNDYLVGNPYASALDSHQFILDNAPIIQGGGATTGTVYFWEHWGGGSHNLAEYLGGYATYNLSGGTPSASQGTNDPDVGTGGTPVKTPGRYIPVGQGFFVIGEANGTINFNNGQRAFQRESANSVFVEINPNGGENYFPGRAAESQSQTTETVDPRTKIRLGFYSVNTIRRQLLLTIDENATTGIDWGYDGRMFDNQIDDMYWMIEGEKLNIQGSNSLELQTVMSLGIHVDDPGMNSITLDSFENNYDNLEIYLYDKELGIFHDLNSGSYDFYLEAGEHFNRFEVTFTNETLGNEEEELSSVDVHYNLDLESLVVINPTLKNIKSIEILNMLGQSIYSVSIDSLDTYAEYKVSNFSSGTYILKINTDSGTFSKKVFIEQI